MNTQGVKSCHANSISIHVARVFNTSFGEVVILTELKYVGYHESDH